MPSFSCIIFCIYYWDAQRLACCRFEERDGDILQIASGIAVDCNVVGAGCLHVVHRAPPARVICDWSAEVVLGFVQRNSTEDSADTHALDGDAFFLI